MVKFGKAVIRVDFNVSVDRGCVSVYILGVHGSLHSEPSAVLSEQSLLQGPASCSGQGVLFTHHHSSLSKQTSPSETRSQ